MPKSRQRKDHKKKAQARTRRIGAEKRKYEKQMQALFTEQIEKMRAAQSGTTETDGPIQQPA